MCSSNTKETGKNKNVERHGTEQKTEKTGRGAERATHDETVGTNGNVRRTARDERGKQ